MPVVGETRVFRNGSWQRLGRGDLGASEFILGTTEPSDANVGVGIIRTAPTTVINGNVTVNAGQTVVDRIINGLVDIEVGGILENCIVRGPAVEPTSSRPLVRVNGHTPTPGGTRAIIRYCEIRPQTPSAFTDAIGYKGYYAYRCNIRDTTDAFAVFSTTEEGLVNVLVEGCYVPRLVQWRPDYAYPGGRSHTHNDVVQFQNNQGDTNDAIFTGNSFNARFVDYAGTQPLENVRKHAAAVMVTPFSPRTGIPEPKVSATFNQNWFKGGEWTVNAGSDNNKFLGQIIFTDNRFERPGTVADAPMVALAIDSDYPHMVSGNTYIDNGATVNISTA